MKRPHLAALLNRPWPVTEKAYSRMLRNLILRLSSSTNQASFEDFTCVDVDLREIYEYIDCLAKTS